MGRPLALALLSWCALLTACASTSSGGGSSGSAAPSRGGTTAGSSAGNDAAPAAATASGGAQGSNPAARADGSADPGVARTPTERRADIDGRLEASLNQFDEQLRREQQRTASDRDAHAAARGDGATAEVTGGADGTDGTDSAGGGRDKDEIHHDRSGDLQSDGTKEAATANAAGGRIGGGGAAAKPIPSGADDDIVARRLRRAAEAETDPELKEKLWKEYTDYKENTKGST